MKNNKGFSVLELIVSFSLTMVIVIVLFEIIVYMKELYEKSVTQTELINKQNIITDYIYSDLIDNNVNEISICGNNCINFSYDNGEIKQLNWNTELNTLQYDNYKINLIRNTNFDQNLELKYNEYTLNGVKICHRGINDSNETNSYISIKIPISNALFENKDFGLDIFYTYNINSVFLDLPYSDNCEQ